MVFSNREINNEGQLFDDGACLGQVWTNRRPLSIIGWDWNFPYSVHMRFQRVCQKCNFGWALDQGKNRHWWIFKSIGCDVVAWFVGCCCSIWMGIVTTGQPMVPLTLIRCLLPWRFDSLFIGKWFVCWWPLIASPGFTTILRDQKMWAEMKTHRSYRVILHSLGPQSLCRHFVASLGCTCRQKRRSRGVRRMNQHYVHQGWWSVPNLAAVVTKYQTCRGRQWICLCRTCRGRHQSCPTCHDRH